MLKTLGIKRVLVLNISKCTSLSTISIPLVPIEDACFTLVFMAF